MIISWCGLVEISPAVPVTSSELKLATVVLCSLWKVADSAEESLAGLGTRCWLPAAGRHEQGQEMRGLTSGEEVLV